MKKSIMFVGISLLIVGVVSIYWFLTEKRYYINNAENDVEIINKEDKIGSDNVFQINNKCLLIDRVNNKFQLKNMNGKLIFYFSIYNCMSCIENQIEVFKELGLNSKNIIIVSNFKTLREMRSYISHNSIPYEIYKVSDNLFKKTKPFSSPFLFKFKNGEIEDFLICTDASGNSTKLFLEKHYSEL